MTSKLIERHTGLRMAFSHGGDTLVFDTSTLRHRVSVFGETQLMLGTDYPLDFHKHRPVAAIDAAGFGAATRDLLPRANAQRFLRLPELEQP